MSLAIAFTMGRRYSFPEYLLFGFPGLRDKLTLVNTRKFPLFFDIGRSKYTPDSRQGETW
jgi:hypothetical protein